jgi:hypothetical protein
MGSMRRGIYGALLLSIAGAGGAMTVQAATFTSPNFSINGNIGDSIAGAQASSSYQMIATGGESIAGSSESKSYKMGQGYVAQFENSIQLDVQPNGLVGYWSLNRTVVGAPAYDDSVTGNNGTYTTGSTSGTGKVGSAWTGAGGAEGVTIPHNAAYPSGDKMTLSGWIYKSGAATDSAIVTKWNYSTTAGSWALQRRSGASGDLRMTLRATGTDGGSNYVDTTNANLADNTWYHITMVYDGSLSNSSRVKFYRDGVPLSTSTVGTIPASITSSTHDVAIGQFPNLARGWTGMLDEIKIYNRALDQKEAQAEYNAGNAGVPAGLAFAGGILPGQSRTANYDAIVQTNSPGYTLAIAQNSNLTGTGGSIPAAPGSIAAPAAWNEGTTKGLGFSLYGTTATPIPAGWGAGVNYAALPVTSTAFYTRSGYTAGSKDIVNMRLRLDVAATQPTGEYANQMTLTGTIIP